MKVFDFLRSLKELPLPEFEDKLEDFLSDAIPDLDWPISIDNFIHPVDHLIEFWERNASDKVFERKLRRAVGNLLRQWRPGKDSESFLIGLITLGSLLAPADFRRELKRLLAGGELRGHMVVSARSGDRIDLHEYLLRALLTIRPDREILGILRTDVYDPRYCAIAYANLIHYNPENAFKYFKIVLQIAVDFSRHINLPHILEITMDRLPREKFVELLRRIYTKLETPEQIVLERALLHIGWGVTYPEESCVLYPPDGKPINIKCPPRNGGRSWKEHVRYVASLGWRTIEDSQNKERILAAAASLG